MATSKKAEKAAIRSRIRAHRQAMTEEKEQFFNEQLFSCLSRMPEIAGASAIYTYISYQKEVDTRRILVYLWELGKAVAAPRVLGEGQMEFFEIHSFADLEPGCMGILEPKLHCRKADAPRAVVLTPGLAFDRLGHRIGYGGGFYDRFFAREPEHRRIGLAFDYQLYDSIPAEACDRRLDRLLAAGEGKVQVYEFERDRQTGEGGVQGLK